MMRRLVLFLALFWLLGLTPSCSGREGTITVDVVSAPDGQLLAQVHRLQATFTSGGQSFEGVRDRGGALHMSIRMDASGLSGDLIVEGFAQTGERIAVGRVGPIPLAALSTTVAVYLAAPMSIAQAPVSLKEARSYIGGTETSFGVLLAGGIGNQGASDAVDVYSSYRHTIEPGLPLPRARSSVAVARGGAGVIYMIGGNDTRDEAKAASFAFDITVAPSGSYRTLSIDPQYARSESSIAIVAQEQFLVSGNPALLLDGYTGSMEAIAGGEGLNGPGATTVADGRLRVILGGANITDAEGQAVGAAMYQDARVTHLQAPSELLRGQHRAITLASHQILFVGGQIDEQVITTAVIYEPTSGEFRVRDFLTRGRRNPAVALTDRYLLIIGGEDDRGQAMGDAEVFDAKTLEAITTIPLIVPRKNASAFALANGQILIAGGQDQDNAPIALLELFTPNE